MSGRECCVNIWKGEAYARRYSEEGGGGSNCATDWAIDAWKAAGRQWKAWSSRAVSTCLQLGGTSRDKLHGVLLYSN